LGIFGRLDAAVNVAGTEGKPGPVTEQTAESYAATFDTNVLGTLLSLKHEMRVMLGQTKVSIINISSTFGRHGGAGASVYAASKHSVEGLTQSAAVEGAAANVRVNVVAPGPIETGMLNRFTGNDDVKARLVSTVPLKRAGCQRKSHSPFCFWPPTRRPSSPGKSSRWTAARLPADATKTRKSTCPLSRPCHVGRVLPSLT
jgi:NAD(P)-dependent dehydrogenase (short-subunit alcohol dehydrogenase family)